MTEFNAQAEWRYLHFVSRVTASMVDCVVQILMLIPIVIYFFPELLKNPEQASQAFQWVAGAVQTVTLLGFWLGSQSTPGKMLFHARIVDADTGAEPTTRQFVIRYAGYIISTLAFFIGFLWAAFDKRNQGWHDKMANTVVVQFRKD